MARPSSSRRWRGTLEIFALVTAQILEPPNRGEGILLNEAHSERPLEHSDLFFSNGGQPLNCANQQAIQIKLNICELNLVGARHMCAFLLGS